MYWKAWSISPPLQPSFPKDDEQSTSYCSEYEVSFPVAMNSAPSTAPVVEKAQHDPHCPWSLTGVTAPLVLQSRESARFSVSRTLAALTSLFLSWALYPNNLFHSL